MDLKILPQYSENADFSSDLISFHRDSNLFEQIRNLEEEKGRKVPRKGIYTFTSRNKDFEEPHYGTTTETPYGDIIKGVMAGELKTVLTDYKTDSWKNKAVIAYVNKLPDNLEIWLYWH